MNMKMRKLLIPVAVAFLAIAMLVAAPAEARGNSKVLEAPAGPSWFQLPTEAYKGKQDDVFLLTRSWASTSTARARSSAARMAGPVGSWC